MLTFFADIPCSLTSSCTSQSVLIPIVVCGFLWLSSLYEPHYLLGTVFTKLHSSFLSCGSVAGVFFCSGKGRNLSFWDCTVTCELLILAKVSLSETLYLSVFWLLMFTEVCMCLLGVFSSWHEVNAQTGVWSGTAVTRRCLLIFSTPMMMRKIWYHLKDALSIVSLVVSYLKHDKKMWLRSAVLK